MSHTSGSADTITGTRALSAAGRWTALAVLMLGTLILSIDGTVLFLAIPSLTRDLSPTAEQLLWISDIYSLAIAGLMVAMGNLADRVGRKRILLVGSAVFALASLVAAFAPDPNTLIAARALLGVAGASIMPSTMALIRNIFTDDRERTRAVALWATTFGGGSAIGPLIGGALIENFSWGSVFLINVPVMLLIIVVGSFLLPESKNPNPGRFDIISALLSLATMTPFIYAIKHSAKHGFDSETALTLIIMVIAGWLFLRRQRRIDDPLLDIELFKNPAFTSAIATNLIAIFSLIGVFMFFSQYLQFVRGFGPLLAGIAELPGALTQIVAPLIIGVVLSRLGRRYGVVLGTLTMSLGMGLLALAENQEGYLWLGVALALVGFGAGIALSLTLDVVLTASPPAKAGAAAALSETSIEIGAVLGISMLGTLLTSLYRSFVEIPAEITGADRAAVADSIAQAMPVVEGTAAEPLVAEAFIHAMQLTSVTAMGVGLLLTIIAWRFIPNGKISSADTDSVGDGSENGASETSSATTTAGDAAKDGAR